jgi:hypothetical protein
MNKEGEFLQDNGRKELVTMHYLSVAQTNWPQVRQWVQEALIIDETN